MRKIETMVSNDTEENLITWAHSLNPRSPRPSIGEAAAMALEDFSRSRRELRTRFAHAARKVDAKLG